MSNGPIEFLGETTPHEFPRTEFGGADGLIQPQDARVLTGDPDASGGHDVLGDKRASVAERSAVLARYGGAALDAATAWTGEDSLDGAVVDPATGLMLDGSKMSSPAGGIGGKDFSDLKP